MECWEAVFVVNRLRLVRVIISEVSWSTELKSKSTTSGVAQLCSVITLSSWEIQRASYYVEARL
jgi:hypothetical protein